MKRLALLALLTSACGYHPKGLLDMSTGLQGIGVDEGSLAGSWVTVVELDAIVPAGLLGDQPGGFRSHFLVTRTWSRGAYTDTFHRCSREPFEVGGSRTLVPADTFPKLAPFSAGAKADHRAGTWTGDDAIELWGLQNLPDPATSPLPNHDTYQQSDQVLDEDGDGEPGVTQFSHGSVGGKMFVVERTVFALDGTIITPDRVQGLAQLRSNHSCRLESTAALLLGETETRQDTGRLSWFDSVRLKDGASCDDVAAALADGTVANSKPF